MVATGASNQQIARQLVISVNTVKVHLRNIFEKLGVQSRTEAIRRALQEGWITIADNGQAPAEPAPAAVHTYLLSGQAPPALPLWQQIYLAGAVVLTLALVIIPLLPQRMLYLPVITPYDNQDLAQNAPEPLLKPDSSRWLAHAAMPTGRAGLGLAAVDDRIYAIAGRRGDIGATSLVEIYHPFDDSWTEGTAKPTATSDVTAVVLDAKIYIPGGCIGSRQPVDVLEIYDPASDRWQQGPALPAPRCGYGAIAAGDKLYLFGGWNGHSYEDSIFVFSPRAEKWDVLPGVMPQAKGYFGVAELNGQIYVVGGYNGADEYDTTHVFVPETGRWLEKARLNEKRGGLGLVSSPQNLYAIGGGWERPLSSSEKYDPNTDSWTVFETPFTGNQWSNLGLTSMNSNIYAIGGWNGTDEQYMDTVVSYQFMFEMFVPILRGN